jgi:hypothetical protein
MTALADQFAPTVATAGRVGQGTAVEQARAATQVQGAIYIARQFPRDERAAERRMMQACSRMELANEAFYSFPRGGQVVAGMTVAVACEIAQCWGNVEYGLTEMRRDDVYGQSEMLAFAWDLETNVRIASTFIVPHTRDTKGGGYKLTDSRDIYETNTNNGNRRMRAAIFKILPSWYVSQAESALRATLNRGVKESGKPLAIQVEEAVGQFATKFEVTAAQIEERIGRPQAKWSEHDLVQLRTIWQSLSRGELRLDEAFPAARVTAAEVLGARPARNGTSQPADEPVLAPVGHIGHAENAFDASCEACQADQAETDQRLAAGA